MDIAVTWNAARGQGDWSMAGGDLASGRDLETAILLSVFTDARVDEPDLPAPRGPPGRRGCWTDSYAGFFVGSRLWTRARLEKTPATLRLIVGDVQDATAWLIEEGVVARFDITASWVNRTLLGLQLAAAMPAGGVQPYAYQWVWGQ